ncbi:MAG: NAD-dependent deacylase [Desulfurococcales archaeon]|nr:NAD-dependent deacylase [Desulfurococcales archaeon]
MGLLDPVVEAARLLRSSRYAIVFTGAGVSAESGIPTFRGSGGLWRRFRPEDLATPEAFQRDPRLVWEWYAWRIKMVLEAEPNPAHRAIARLEEAGLVKAVITQNVDGLHRWAGSSNVVELHGSILRVRCTRCSYRSNLARVPSEIPPRCPRCGGLLRPDVVWFGEPLPRGELERAWREAGKADLVIVVGTSGVVEPAASIPLIVLSHGGSMVNVNPEPNRYTGLADVEARMTAARFFSLLLAELGLGDV